MKKLLFLVVEIICIICVISVHSADGSKLLLFLLDGFRWDYFDQPDMDLPGFSKMFDQGVRAEYMDSDNPTLSYPNYYSIMTGLHCEDHGMVGNFMYDEKFKEYFLVGANKEQYHSFWWDDGEPVWITASRQGKSSYMYHWPGCDVTIRNRTPTYCKPYRGVPQISDLQESISESIQLFKNNSADLVGIYVELTDKLGHKYGPKSDKLNQVIVEIDKEVNKLMDTLEYENLRDDVNIMVFSDHGMTDVSPSRVINITGHVNMEDVDVMLDSGPNVYVWPKNGKLEKVYKDLKQINNPHLSVYKKQDIPDEWFYKRHYRISPIMLMAEVGWYIITPAFPVYYFYFDSGPMSGHHGYDKIAKDMRAIFVGTGPEFKSNYRARPFSNVNLYQIMCSILDIEPSPHNGTWKAVSDMLVDNAYSSYTVLTASIGIIATMVLFVSTIL